MNQIMILKMYTEKDAYPDPHIYHKRRKLEISVFINKVIKIMEHPKNKILCSYFKRMTLNIYWHEITFPMW